MNILFHCTLSDSNEWLKSLKKKFKGHKFLTVNKNTDYNKVEIAVIWNLPNHIFRKIKNVHNCY